MSTFGKLESGRKGGGGGGGGGGGAEVARAAADSQRKVEEGARQAGSGPIDVDRELAKDAAQKAVRPVITRAVAGSMAKKGGRITKTGVYTLHRGEVVLPAKVVKRIAKRKPTRKSGRR
jgi:hypothetical protein